MATIYLSLGSNKGDRAQYIARALEALSACGVRVTRKSSLYETEPVETSSKSWFLNCVVEAQTDLLPPQLMHWLLDIERALGRRRRVPRGPRFIDIDVLFYEDRVVSSEQLEIPHPRMAERRFVLVPFAEIAPEVRHPIFRKTIAELLEETPDRSEVRPHQTKTTE
ncbi:MAG: 2-amino-4-hydroxy-6-hydroxymethyldihydropteridine diphosphokinase [Candidatus Acidiferrales bacterium]|jgi:2-amino-4-hydroxy-6-hydroxymethyldihydropteridine diphosphokinase